MLAGLVAWIKVTDTNGTVRQLTVKEQVVGVLLGRQKADADKTRCAESRTNPQVWLITKTLCGIENVLPHCLRSHRIVLADMAHDLLQVIRRDGIDYDRLHADCLRSWDNGMRWPGWDNATSSKDSNAGEVRRPKKVFTAVSKARSMSGN
jgi:hypothetical protein